MDSHMHSEGENSQDCWRENC